MSFYYQEIVTNSTYGTAGQYEFGFTARGIKLVLRSGGPMQFSFDGSTDHGDLGPSGTRPMEFQLESGRLKSGIWLKAPSNEIVQVWAWD